MDTLFIIGAALLYIPKRAWTHGYGGRKIVAFLLSVVIIPKRMEENERIHEYYNVAVVLMTKGRRCYLAYSTLLHWSLLWCPQEYGLYNIKVCNPSLLLLICPHHSNYEEWGLAMTT